jgi:uncharacterized protein (TIGR02611 family)
VESLRVLVLLSEADPNLQASMIACRSSNLSLALVVECRSMIERAKENWRRFKQSKPGHRFQDHHYRYQQSYGSRSYLRGFFSVIGGLLVVAGGLVAVPGPGPGWLIILLGLGMVAGESLFSARLLDRAEIRLRGLARWVAGIWRTSPAFVKVLIFLAILACAFVIGIWLIT